MPFSGVRYFIGMWNRRRAGRPVGGALRPERSRGKPAPTPAAGGASCPDSLPNFTHPNSRRSLLLLAALALGVPSFLPGVERQSHGFAFEEQVWNHLFDRGYTDEWDIPGAANLRNPGVPISVKYIRWGSSIYLGDAIRQRTIAEPFEMIVGFHETVDGERRTVAIHHLTFSPEEWEQAWGEITAGELEAFAERIQEGTVEDAQNFARERAAELRQRSGIFSINPKINKDQRRIQCSIPFTRFYKEWIGTEPVQQENLELWDRPF